MRQVGARGIAPMAQVSLLPSVTMGQPGTHGKAWQSYFLVPGQLGAAAGCSCAWGAAAHGSMFLGMGKKGLWGRGGSGSGGGRPGLLQKPLLTFFACALLLPAGSLLTGCCMPGTFDKAHPMVALCAGP